MGSTLCTGTHNYEDPNFSLVIRPVIIDDEAWVGAEAFIGPGVHVLRGGVIGARSTIMKGMVGEGEVWAGAPARYRRPRNVSGDSEASQPEIVR